jgi:hypothetical protein
MSSVVNSILERIGDTSLVRLNRLTLILPRYWRNWRPATLTLPHPFSILSTGIQLSLMSRVYDSR